MNKRVLRSLVLIGLTVFGLAGPCNAEEPTSSPAKVAVGVYVNKIDQISLKDGSIDIDFYIWFRWTADNLKPQDSFELVNGEIKSREGMMESILGSMNYACVRVRATLQKSWDITRFPLDSHTITLMIESSDLESHKLLFEADATNSGLNGEAELGGWTLTAGGTHVRFHDYATNYGDISLPTGAKSTYSQFGYSLQIARPGYALFIKLFAGLYIAAAIGFLSLLIRPIDLDPRFGLGVGAMFAAVASQYVLASNLPDSSCLTMADKLHIQTFVFIFATLLESTISLQIWNGGHQERAQRLDRYSLICLVSTYAATSAIVVYTS